MSKGFDEIQKSLQELINNNQVPESITKLISNVKGKIDIRTLKQINKSKKLDGEQFNKFIELTRGIIFGIDSILMREEGLENVEFDVRLKNIKG